MILTAIFSFISAFLGAIVSSALSQLAKEIDRKNKLIESVVIHAAQFEDAIFKYSKMVFDNQANTEMLLKLSSPRSEKCYETIAFIKMAFPDDDKISQTYKSIENDFAKIQGRVYREVESGKLNAENMFLDLKKIKLRLNDFSETIKLNKKRHPLLKWIYK